MAYRKQAAAQISLLLLQQWPIDLTCASLQPVNHVKPDNTAPLRSGLKICCTELPQAVTDG